MAQGYAGSTEWLGNFSELSPLSYRNALLLLHKETMKKKKRERAFQPAPSVTSRVFPTATHTWGGRGVNLWERRPAACKPDTSRCRVHLPHVDR